VQAARDRRRQHRVPRRDYALATAARGCVVVQPADPANQGGAAHRRVPDADRGSWGDPLADWTFFLLSRRACPQEQALFWQEYGQPLAGGRAQVYQGLHQGKILSVARRDGNEQAANRAYRARADAVNALQVPLFSSLCSAACTSGGSAPGTPGPGAGSR